MADSDEEFSYDVSNTGALHETGMSTLVQNQPHDEEVELSDDYSNVGEDFSDGQPSGFSPEPDEESKRFGDSPPNVPPNDGIYSNVNSSGSRRIDEDYGQDDSYVADADNNDTNMTNPVEVENESQIIHKMNATAAARDMPTIDGNNEEESESGNNPNIGKRIKYDPKSYIHLNDQVNSEIASLFESIERYKPQEIELETKLKCFIPEYLPAMGDVDEFIKVARPDGRLEESGLKYVDEPCANQSDTAVLNLHLRQSSKHVGSQPLEVASISDPTKNQSRIAAWIRSIDELHKAKPNLTSFSGMGNDGVKSSMPDIESLMIEWESEEMANRVAQILGSLATCDALNISEMARVMCALLNIPVYEDTNVVESLHTMMTLFLSFKTNPIYNPEQNTQYQT